MVPLRIISEELGAQVHWDSTARTVRVALPDGDIRLGIGKSTAFVRDQEHKLDAAPIIVGGRTMVPLRFIGEALGAQVHWDAPTRTVHVTGARAEVQNVVLQPELGREVLAIKGTGHLQGTVTQSDNQVLITLPEAELALAEGPLALQGTLVQGVSVQSLARQAKGVVVTVTLSEPTPLPLPPIPGNLLWYCRIEWRSWSTSK